jgi:hypothetical protein
VTVHCLLSRLRPSSRMSSSIQPSAKKGPSEPQRRAVLAFVEPSTVPDTQNQSTHRARPPKSRSPEAKGIQRRATPDVPASGARKQKKSFSVSLVGGGSDHSKSKQRSTPFTFPTLTRSGIQNTLVGETSVRKESSRSRDSQKWTIANTLTTASSDRSDTQTSLAEVARLKSDIEQLRKVCVMFSSSFHGS